MGSRPWLHPVAALRLGVAASRLETSFVSSLNELLFENVFWFVMDLMAFQHANKFFLKRFFAMVLLLVQHVSPYFANLRLTNGKSTITRLPFKRYCWLDLFIDHLR